MTNEIIEFYREHLKPIIQKMLLETNYQGQGEVDYEEFGRDFDELLDLAIIGMQSNSDEDRKALIHKILEQGYINFATRRNYDKKIQESTISQNRGLKFACCSIIEGSSNEEELYEYFKREILRIENSGEQQVSIKEWKKE